MKHSKLLFLCISLLIFSIACHQSKPQKYQLPAIPPSQPTTQLKPLNAPAEFQFQSVQLSGQEIPYKSLKFENAANGQKIAKHNGVLFTGTTVYLIADNQIYIYQNYLNGIKHGPYQLQKNSTDDNGNPDNTFEVGTMNNGKIDGLQLTYYDGPGGPLKKVSVYNNDVMNAQWSSYYRDGQQWTRRDFNNGTINGKVLVWDEEGLLGKEFTYRNGALIEKLNHFENR